MSEKVDASNLTLSQEAELNAKAASLEGFEQKMGFESYYKLGEKRSLAKAAADLGRSVKTVENWAVQFRWTARVRERERMAAEYLLMQKSAEEESKTKEKHLTLIDATISKWSQLLIANEIKLKTVDDLQKLIAMRWELADKPDRRVNPVGVAGSSGAMLDLRLRGMPREELQKFLHGTLRGIERLMNKKPLTGPAEPKSGEKINMDLRVQIPDAGAQSPVIDVTPTPSDLPSSIGDDLADLGSLDFDPSSIEDL